jgi:hypothetical protein
MCGLNFGLVTAAHIDPVATVDSVDEVWNGLCLCPNHHAAFDSYRLWINPTTGEIRLHPDLAQASDLPGDRAIREMIGSSIERPATPQERPRAEMFQRRYALPAAQRGYAWV